jgi:antitoxin PrlF
VSTATLTSKGQVTIPVEVRSALGLSAGDRIDFIPTENGSFEIVPATSPITALKGLIKKPAKPVSIDEMNAAIAERGAAGR